MSQSWNFTVLLISVLGDEEDDDARQQHHHHDHRRQEDGPAQRPARQSEQDPAHARRLAGAPWRRAGKPHVQTAVHRPQRRQRPLTPALLTLRRPGREEQQVIDQNIKMISLF